MRGAFELFFVCLQKIANFKKHKMPAMRAAKLLASRRRQKSRYRYEFWKLKKLNFQKKSAIFRKPNGTRPLGPKSLASRRRPNSSWSRDLWIFSSHFCAQLADRGIFTPVACGLHYPRPKDCPGLGDPNTLKLFHHCANSWNLFWDKILEKIKATFGLDNQTIVGPTQ